MKLLLKLTIPDNLVKEIDQIADRLWPKKVGDPHAPTCVCLHRIVKVRYSFDIEIEVPHNWNKESIEFQKNESTWCANNALDELNEFAENLNGCLCPYFQAEVLEIPDAEPYRKNNQGRKIIN